MKSRFEKQLKQHITETLERECPEIKINGTVKVSNKKQVKSFNKKTSYRILKMAACFIAVIMIGTFISSQGINNLISNRGGYYGCPGLVGSGPDGISIKFPIKYRNGLQLGLSEDRYKYDLEYNGDLNDKNLNENKSINTSKEKVSTFSIDVDTASYSNIRRFIRNGIIPPVEMIRIEEMINYFSYNYPQPKGDDPFSVTTEIGKCPWDDGKYLAMIGIKGKDIPKENLPLSNLVFLIDVSGSMSGEDKLPLLKSAFKLLVEQLGENDRVSIVVYAGSSGVVLDGAHGNEKDKIISALESLVAGGYTAGSAGIQKAYELAKMHYIPGGNNRVVLATDGDFNVGISSPKKLKKFIEEKRKEGVFLSVLGFGMSQGGDEVMETLADAGNGNYAHIDSLQEARKVLVEEMGGTLLTIAKDVKVQVIFNPETVTEYRLIGYENRILNKEDFKDDTKDAGEIGAGHTVTAIYEIVLSKNVNKGDKLFDLNLRYKKPQENESKELNFTTQYVDVESNSSDFNFAGAVAQFGLILKNSKYKGKASISSVMNIALNNLGEDAGGYRKEFIQLVKKYEELINKQK